MNDQEKDIVDEEIEQAAAASGDRAQDAPAESGGDDDLVARIVEERDAYRDQLLRARAEFDNYRKRMERERSQLSARVAEDAVRDFLPIIDDLERALAADTGDAGSSIHQGVEMIYKQALEVLRRRGLEPIDAIGQDFDPNIHEAVAYEPAEGRREGEIIGELRRGYRIGDRLVRPSMVRVAQELK